MQIIVCICESISKIYRYLQTNFYEERGGGPDFFKRRVYSISLLDHRKLNFQGAAHNNFFSRKNYRYHAQIHKKNLREGERGISN